MRFFKYSGAGNDFVIVAAEEMAGLAPDLLAQRICARSTGVGADGLVLVRRLGPTRVEARFFNPDGSEFSTCGNGTRSAARYALDLGLVDSEPFTAVTAAAEITAASIPGGIALEYLIEARIAGERRVPFDGEPRTGWLVHIGLPHFVLPLQALPEGSIEDACRPIRHHRAFSPEGANVNLVALHQRRSGEIRTFERGVEGETPACGSGAMAAVLALHVAGRCDRSVALRTRSSEVLEVTLGQEAVTCGESGRVLIGLAGPVRRLFEGFLPAGGAH
ncbi:MAG: diaminopimelate epimerase [Gemmatimonadota bacterium]